MEEISPLFAIQAEKALKANNPQLAIEICKRGLEFFSDYQMGYILLAEAYEMIGAKDERDKVVEQIHRQFPKAITTKAIDDKIKTEGTLLANNQELPDIEANLQENEELTEGGDLVELSDIPKDKDEQSVEQIQEELANIDELIDEAQSVVEDIEETIEDLEDEIAKFDQEFVEQLIETEKEDSHNEELIQEYAELESEIADMQDYAEHYDKPESIVELSEDLLELEKIQEPFETDKNSLEVEDFLIDNPHDINLIDGINYLPFGFDYNKIFELSKNLTLENFANSQMEDQNIYPSNELPNVEKTPEYVLSDNIEKITEDEGNNEIEVNNEKHFPDDFIPTETLAMIYEKQGKYMNAIDIYQKLMEIHPEKMEYYLNKIMSLETDGN